MNQLPVQQLTNHFQRSQHFYFLITDRYGVVEYLNPLFEHQSGYNLQRQDGFSITDMMTTDDVNRCRLLLEECIDKRSTVSTPPLPHHFGNDAYAQVVWEISPVDDEAEKFQWIGKVVTREEFFKKMISHSLDGIVMVNVAGTIIYCGPSVTKLSGYPTDFIIGKILFDFVHPDDQNIAIEAYELEVNKLSVVNYLYLRLLHSNGTWVWCTVRGHNLLNEPGINAMVIYFTDDSYRKAIEDKLRESETRFRNMIHNLKLGVLLMNEKAEMLACNQAALDLLDLNEVHLTGKQAIPSAWNVVHEDGSIFPADTHPVPVAIQTKKPVRDVVMGVYRPSRKDRVWLLANAEPVLDSNENIINVICSLTDITERKRLSEKLVDLEIEKQKQLIRATIETQEKERMEIGRELHDNISQHITTTRLYLEVARDKASGEVHNLIRQAHTGLLSTVNEMRKLSQSLVPPSLNDIGLVESVEDLCNTLKNSHTFTIDFQHKLFEESRVPDNMKLTLFRIIQEQINNIIRHSGADNIAIILQTSEGHVNLYVRDNGIGFDPHSVKKGIGLANISNRASLFAGKSEIISSPGKGASVYVSIPLTQARQPKENADKQ